MSLNWNIGNVSNYREACYDRVTREEAVAAGTTVEALLAQSSFMGPNWYTPGASEVEKLANCDVVERLNPLTNCLIWATMGLGMRGIREDNYAEFFARIAISEKVNGTYLNQKCEDGEGWEPRPIALDEVKAHIGLSTNVSEESWTTWISSLMGTVRSEVLRGADLPDDRGLPGNMPLSQHFKDVADGMDALFRRMKNNYFEDDEALDRFDQDYEKACRAQEWLNNACDTWNTIEARLDDEGEE